MIGLQIKADQRQLPQPPPGPAEGRRALRPSHPLLPKRESRRMLKPALRADGHPEVVWHPCRDGAPPERDRLEHMPGPAGAQNSPGFHGSGGEIQPIAPADHLHPGGDCPGVQPEAGGLHLHRRRLSGLAASVYFYLQGCVSRKILNFLVDISR